MNWNGGYMAELLPVFSALTLIFQIRTLKIYRSKVILIHAVP